MSTICKSGTIRHVSRNGDVAFAFPPGSKMVEPHMAACRLFPHSTESLEIAGYALGWPSKPQAIAAASEILRDAGHRLAKLWGIG